MVMGKILLPLDSNIDLEKYMQIFYANLWPFVAEHFVESLLCSRMTCTGTLLTSLLRLRRYKGI